MSEISVLNLNKKLSKEKLDLIDVREYVEFCNGRIKDSINVPFNSVGELHKEYDSHQTIYLVSNTGKRAEDAKGILDVIGFTDVHCVTGGLEAWQKAGFELEKDAEPLWKIERQANLLAGSLVVIGNFLAFAVHWTFLIIPIAVGIVLLSSAGLNECHFCNILFKMPWNKKLSEK